MDKSYHVSLTAQDRDHLEALIAVGVAPARTLHHGRILLNADAGPEGPAWPDQRIAEAVAVSQPTISRVRKQDVQEGLDAALDRRMPRRVYQRKLDGAQEAHLLARACSTPPAGQARWSRRVRADRLVELAVVDDISDQTVRTTLKKTSSSRG